MKKGLVLAIVLLSFTGSSIFAKKKTKRIPSTQQLCENGECKKKYNNRGEIINQCSCYCSKLCGPREIQPSDKPQLVDATEAQELGIPSQCYCQQTDIDNYIPHCVEGKAYSEE